MKSMKFKDIIFTVKNCKRAYKNWISVLFQQYKIMKISNTDQKHDYKIKVILRDDNSHNFLALNRDIVNAFAAMKNIDNENLSNLTIKNNKICFSYKKIPSCLEGDWSIYETFFKEEYSFLKVDNEIVIDIGANIGDTALYFCCNGAKKVISLEPYPYTFSIARTNITNSLFNDKIELIDAAYGKDEIIKIDNTFIPKGGSDLKRSNFGNPIYSFSLKTILLRYNINEAILKMDCEGCEYNILNEDTETIQKFKIIQIEYHYGYESLYNFLTKAGFSVEYTSPKMVFNKIASNPNMSVGFLYAKRI